MKEYNKRYYTRRREEITLQRKLKRHSDPETMLVHNLRGRLRTAITACIAKKHGNTMSLLGCTASQFRTHLESQFTLDMTWENYGLWHVDHIIPCAAFDLTDPEQQRACFHYTNLQPLWGIDNLKKGAKMPELTLPSG